MNLELLSAFPEEYEPNEAQDYILEEVGNAIEEEKKFIIINAPTGTGKSFIAKTFGNYSLEQTSTFTKACYDHLLTDPDFSISDKDIEPRGCAILTVTKQLQEQYGNLFNDPILKGKSNYQCAINDMFSCDIGPCKVEKGQMKKCLNSNLCPYYNKMNKAVTSKCSIYNYSMFDCLDPILKNKEFLVCDEASELEAELVSMKSMTIVPKEIKKIFNEDMTRVHTTPSATASESVYFDWVCNMANLIEYERNTYVNSLYKNFKEKKNKKLTKTERERLNLLTKYNNAFKNLTEAWNKSKYIISRIDGNILFQPLNVDKIAHECFFDYGKTVILMSATIVNHKKFAETLGITDYYYIEAKNPMCASKAPIRCATKWYVNYKNQQKVIPQIAKAIEGICQKHKGQKGIIHTHSMSILNMLRTNMKPSSRFLYREQGVTNANILDMHTESLQDTILVSPSMTHGVDLKGDLGEFQIIIKAPYLPLGDERIKQKFNTDKEWYLDCMLSTLIQTSGRCNRSVDDFSTTYILDGCIVDAIIKNKEKLPKYFLDRIL